MKLEKKEDNIKGTRRLTDDFSTAIVEVRRQ